VNRPGVSDHCNHRYRDAASQCMRDDGVKIVVVQCVAVYIVGANTDIGLYTCSVCSMYRLNGPTQCSFALDHYGVEYGVNTSKSAALLWLKSNRRRLA
jgi:hypothetical protein